MSDVGDRLPGYDSATGDPVSPSRGWQPIETAPKDGTRIWIFTPGYTQENGYRHEPFMLTAWWDENEGEDGALVAPLSDGFEVAVTYHFASPTHWMPLPPPPVSA
jgi:hypothetical protein